jgi:hypothetical protein
VPNEPKGFAAGAAGLPNGEDACAACPKGLPVVALFWVFVFVLDPKALGSVLPWLPNGLATLFPVALLLFLLLPNAPKGLAPALLLAFDPKGLADGAVGLAALAFAFALFVPMDPKGLGPEPAVEPNGFGFCPSWLGCPKAPPEAAAAG